MHGFSFSLASAEVFKEWDTRRSQHAAALDALLESLGSKLVPPSFHETDSDSSIFGSPSSEEDTDAPHKLGSGNDIGVSPTRSPTLTIRGSHAKLNYKNVKHVPRREDRSRWKTLRDFADERGIEEALETMDNERNELDVRPRGSLPRYSFADHPTLYV